MLKAPNNIITIKTQPLQVAVGFVSLMLLGIAIVIFAAVYRVCPVLNSRIATIGTRFSGVGTGLQTWTPLVLF